MRKLFLHIGPHKTGTTYIQSCFSGARGQLGKLGLLYPEVDDLGPGHHGLANELFEGRDISTNSSLVSEIEDLDIIYSSEQFSRLGTKSITKLKSLFPKHQLTVIYYVRRRSDVFLSRWQEIVKHGEVDSFPRYVATRLSRATEIDWLNFCLMSEKFSALTENQSVVFYDNLVGRNQDIADFLLNNIIGLNCSIGTGVRVNSKVDEFLTELLRMGNLLHRKERPKIDTEFTNRFFRRLKVDADLTQQLEAWKSQIAPQFLDLRKIDGLFKESDREFLGKYKHCFANDSEGYQSDVPSSIFSYYESEELLLSIGGWSAIQELYSRVMKT